jgi:hypothetical protein
LLQHGYPTKLERQNVEGRMSARRIFNGDIDLSLHEQQRLNPGQLLKNNEQVIVKLMINAIFILLIFHYEKIQNNITQY